MLFRRSPKPVSASVDEIIKSAKAGDVEARRLFVRSRYVRLPRHHAIISRSASAIGTDRDANPDREAKPWRGETLGCEGGRIATLGWKWLDRKEAQEAQNRP